MTGFTRTDAADARLTWRKSSYSGNSNGQCIEVAQTPRTVHVRDSKDAEGPSLAFTLAEFRAFTQFAATFTG
ncbi:DUF397 domain-containing protein [Streptomyces sp. HSW2009]|uniref:DUF397 domain-containing protein n=1 Tax=Streptomyces sp. HSW2009 TaxID=3142890 RepID=UPI0032ECE016